jgi:hypothetical protein
MDDDLQKLYVALQHAEREWREHIETGFASWYGSDPQTAIGTAGANAFNREWRERETELKGKLDAAREAWLRT